eukprot:scaffold14306_cov80-Isochrysis_galbana.AAC.1
MSVPFQQSARAHATLAALSAAVDAGYAAHTLQRSPHLTLLNEEWYHGVMKPIMAQWMLLWLEANHVAGLPTEHVLAYISRDNTGLMAHEWDDQTCAAAATETAAAGKTMPGRGTGGWAAACLQASIGLRLEKGLVSPKAMQLLNLCEEWLGTFLPHCLQKVSCCDTHPPLSPPLQSVEPAVYSAANRGGCGHAQGMLVLPPHGGLDAAPLWMWLRRRRRRASPVHALCPPPPTPESPHLPTHPPLLTSL